MQTLLLSDGLTSCCTNHRRKAQPLLVLLNQSREQLKDSVNAAIKQLLCQDTFPVICIWRCCCWFCSEQEEAQHSHLGWTGGRRLQFPRESYKSVKPSHGSVIMKRFPLHYLSACSSPFSIPHIRLDWPTLSSSAVLADVSGGLRHVCVLTL